MLAPLIAQELHSSFVPLRKKGKIAGQRVSTSYSKEYGTDTLELRSDLQKGKKTLIVDDILATGGSLKASADLAKLVGLDIVDIVVIRDVPSLRSKANDKLEGLPLRVLIR